MGRNLEQAMLLAVEDVNRAGGVDGVPLELQSTDSNSGSNRGLADLQQLIGSGDIAYLIGPEENELAGEIVPDVKAENILNILPGYAAPSSRRAGTYGAWLRLAPTTSALGCGLAGHAVEEGATLVNALSSKEDYNASLASEFSSNFRRIVGQAAPSVTVEPNRSSYVPAIEKVLSYSPDRTLLITYPATAANIVTDWDVLGAGGSWYLSPLLRSDALLINIPFGALDGQFGMSPSLSLKSECVLLDGYAFGKVSCRTDNAKHFIRHFTERWEGARPFPAAHLYYDAVVLLALALNYAAATREGDAPNAKQLHRLIRDLSQPENAPAYWHDLPAAVQRLEKGQKSRYVGAGAEYEFDDFGVAQHVVFDTWTIRNHEFSDTGGYYAKCFVQQ